MSGELAVYHCPRCGAENEKAGEVADDGGGPPLAVFQCDSCVVPVRFGTATFDAAYTYGVSPDGRVVDVSPFAGGAG